MAVLAACIETGAAHIDTAIHEDPAKTCEGAALVRELRVEAGAGLRRRRRDRDPGRGLRPAWSTPTLSWRSTNCSTRSARIDIIDIKRRSLQWQVIRHPTSALEINFPREFYGSAGRM